MAEIFSFDVFDTCITRIYSQPAHLFIELARVTLLESNNVISDSAINMLAKHRQLAESNAREKSIREDVQLKSIYHELSLLREPTFDAEAMLSKELDLELKSTVPIFSTLALYKEILASGRRIIFASDMYLPQATVLSLLNRCGYEARSEDLYLSGEIGLKKRTGNLYRHILQKENVLPECITHHGDHLISDIRMAKACGLKAVHITAQKATGPYEALLLHSNTVWQKLFDMLQRSSRHIRKMYREPLSKLPPEKMVALSRLTAVSRILLRNKSEADPADIHLQAIGYFVAAPLFTSFVTWLLDTAHAQGISRLYFVARNGQIFYRLAQNINLARGYNIELRYLYGSRAAWYPSSFESFDSQFIELLLKKYPHKSAINILKDLGLPDDKLVMIGTVIQQSICHNNHAVEEESVRAVLIWLSKSDHSVVISEHLSSCRVNVIDYLSQENIFDHANFGIVDIGWHLSTHNALHRILAGTNKRGFKGFYFGVGKKRQQVAGDAPFSAYISDEMSNSESWLFKLGAMSLLEEVFAPADHPTTSGYYREDSRVFPRLDNASSNTLSQTAKAIQDAMIAFSNFVIEKDLLDDLNLVRSEVLAQFERLYKYPNSTEARSIADTPIFALTSHSDSQRRTLAHSIRSIELARIIVSVLLARRDMAPQWVWLQGSMAMSNPLVSTTGRFLSFLESVLLKVRG